MSLKKYAGFRKNEKGDLILWKELVAEIKCYTLEIVILC